MPKKIKLHTPKDNKSEYENFEELAKRLIRVKKEVLKDADPDKIGSENSDPEQDENASESHHKQLAK
jgi:hypothetical protein